MFLDYAEDQARRRKQIFLSDWPLKLDDFLKFNERDVLPNAGNISRERANARAEREYDSFAERRRVQAEADGEAAALKELENMVRMLESKPLKSPPKKRGK